MDSFSAASKSENSCFSALVICIFQDWLMLSYLHGSSCSRIYISLNLAPLLCIHNSKLSIIVYLLISMFIYRTMLFPVAQLSLFLKELLKYKSTMLHCFFFGCWEFLTWFSRDGTWFMCMIKGRLPGLLLKLWDHFVLAIEWLSLKKGGKIFYRNQICGFL